MKTQLKYAAACFALLLCAGASAQTLQEAVRLTENEQYDKAKSMFKQLVAKEPTSGDNYFYFGDLLLKMDDVDSAKIVFEKGNSINQTNPLVHVGLARYYMSAGNRADGIREIVYAKSVVEKSKDIPAARQSLIYLEIAKTYLVGKPTGEDADAAIALTNTAEKLDPKNTATLIDAHIVRGDALYVKDNMNGSPAIKEYVAAAKLDPKSTKANVRIGEIYANGQNHTGAIGYYNLALKTDSSFAPAYRLRGQSYYLIGKYDSAAVSYAKYLKLNDDCYARYRYSAFLYKSGDFDNAIKQGQLALVCDSSITVVYRIVGRSYMEMKTPDPAKAVEYFSLFFKKQKLYGKPAVIPEDYVYRGKAYARSNQDSLSIIDYKMALKQDTARKDAYFDIASAYFKMKRYDSAAYYYKKKIDANPAKAGITEWNAYGRAVFLTKDYQTADDAFKKVTELDSLNPVGWYWRGRSNAQMDPDIKSDNARMYYEKFYDLAIADKEKNKKDLITAAKYLGGYHIVKKNYACSKAWFQFALDLDPANADLKKQLEEKELKTATAAEIGTCKMVKP